MPKNGLAPNKRRSITWSNLVIRPQCINSLRPSDAIWRQRSRSTLAQVMACCLTAPSHYLNQCWLIISNVQWHSSEGNFTRNNSAIDHWNKLENFLAKISFISPRGQWVNSSPHAAYMHQWNGSALCQIMAWHKFSDKPSPEYHLMTMPSSHFNH